MSSEFVRYSPEIETIDPHIDELLEQIIGFWEKKGRESPRREGTGRAVRGAHAKSFGVVKAEVEILNDAPTEYAQGIYATPGHHDALIRFSSTSGHLGPDAQLGAGIGLAMKIFGVDGPNLVDDEPLSHLLQQYREALPVHRRHRDQRTRLPEERFMISTHPWVLEKFAVKARDYDEYIAMRRASRAAELAAAAGNGVSHTPQKQSGECSARPEER